MKRKDSWASSPTPVCPNNSRHELTPHAKGGHVCESCEEQLAGTRTRAATRWAFATTALDEMLDRSLESHGEGLPSEE
jgi:hypothetical protein